MKAVVPNSWFLQTCLLTSVKPSEGPLISRRFIAKMSAAKEFPPEKVRAVVNEVAGLLKERKETVSVAETVCCFICPLSLVVVSMCLVSSPQLFRLSTFHTSFNDEILYRSLMERLKSSGGVFQRS
jgi:hypothetical protein